MANKIKYTDLIESGVVDRLIDELRDLKKEAQKNPLGDGKNVKKFNEALEDTIQITQDLVDIQTEDNEVIKEQKEELAGLNKEYRDLTKAEKANESQIKKLNKQIVNQDTKLNKLKKSVDKTEKSVGTLNKKFQAGALAIKVAVIAIIASMGRLVTEAVFSNQRIADSIEKVNNTLKFSTLNTINAIISKYDELGKNEAFEKTNATMTKGLRGYLALLTLGLSEATIKAWNVFTKSGSESAKEVTDLTNRYVKEQASAIRLEGTNRAKINDLRLKGEDEARYSLQERIGFLKEAFVLENDIANAVNVAQKTSVEILTIQDDIINNNETELALATAQAKVNNNVAASKTRQIEINNKINAITKQGILLERQGREEELQHELQLSLLQAGEFKDPIQRAQAELAAWAIYYDGKIRLLENLRAETEKGSVAWITYSNTIAQTENAFKEQALAIQNQVSNIETLSMVNQLLASGAINAAGQVASALSESAQAQQIIATAVGAVNAALAVTQVFADPKTTSIYEKIAAVLIAIGTGIGLVQTIRNVNVPSYAEGTEYLTGRKNGATGGILIEGHEGERITPTHINNQLMGVSNNALPGLVNMGMMYKDGGLFIMKQQLNELKQNNRLLRGGLKWVDHDGSIVDAEGKRKTYVN